MVYKYEPPSRFQWLWPADSELKLRFPESGLSFPSYEKLMTIDLYQILKPREREGYPARGLTTAALLEVVCLGQSFIDSMYIKPEMEFHTQMLPVFCPSSESERSVSAFTLCLFPFWYLTFSLVLSHTIHLSFSVRLTSSVMSPVW